MGQAGSIGVGDDSWVIMNPFYPGYASAGPENRTEVAVHELFHAYQNGLSSYAPGGGTEDLAPFKGPRWLSEGTASFFDNKVMMDADGALSYEEERMASGRGYVARARRVKTLLSEMETREGLSGVTSRQVV